MPHASAPRLALTAGIGVALLAHALPAQSDRTLTVGAQWAPFLGCWSTSTAGVSGPMVCLIPTQAIHTIELATVVGDSIIARVPVTASGERVPRSIDGCTGWESARWSQDTYRLYTSSEFTCPVGGTQRSSGLFALTTSDAFVRIESIRTRTGTRSRVVNFVAQHDSSIFPSQILASIPSTRSIPMTALRIEASNPLMLGDVIDAAKGVDAPVLEAFLAERAEAYQLGVKELRVLQSAGVPDGVVDMLVAVSYPRAFALERGGRPVARVADPFANRGNNAGSAQFLAEQAYRRQMNSLLRNSSVFGWGGVFGAWFDDPQFYGLNPYGNGFLNPFGFQNFGGFNNGLGGGWVNGNTPYVIVPNNPQPSPSNSGPGRVINGLGYTAERPGDSDGGATPRPNIGSDGGGSRGSSGASSGGGSASSGEGERTAKPRPQL